MRALISVYDKTGLDEFARGLAELGIDLIASGGTAAYLEERGLAATPVEDVTRMPELLGGRVKTLHPRLHAGILARRDLAGDVATLDEHDIDPFDFVCVNFYPFTGEGAEREAVELIDIGGPSLLRAAAKNYEHVAPLCRPDQYAPVLDELRSHGELAFETRRELAAAAFAATAAYEASIAAWFARGDDLPRQVVLALGKAQDLAYGENPHQRAAYYADAGAEAHLLAGVEQLRGRELSFINVYDLASARLLLEELTEPACVIVKHANPCGVAVGATIEDAYARAFAGDPVSAFGMVCALNRPVTEALGTWLAERFVDVLFAPSYDDGALERLARKPATRILAGPGRLRADDVDWKRVPGGFLMQERDDPADDRASMHVVCGDPSAEAWRDLLFAWTVSKHVTSNAIVIAKELQAIGIAAGQQSRVDAVRLALDKAGERGHDVAGAVLASDAFFPFADGPQLALDAGVTAIVQPGGSKRDEEVIAAVADVGAAMVFTGRRHFRH